MQSHSQPEIERAADGRLLTGPRGLGTSAARIRRPVPPPSDELEPLRIPKFQFPWDSASHADADSAEREAIEFAVRYHLIPDASYHARVVRTKYGWLAARCYPNADRELLQILADYFIWFFIVDDLFVDRVETVTAHTIPRLTACIDVLDFHRAGHKPVFGELAWLNVCTRLRRRLSREHFQRFAHGMRMWAATAGLQIVNHLQAQSVDIPTYETIRRHTSGTYPCLDVLDAANAGPTSSDEYHHPYVERLRLHTNNVVCWSNDIQSVLMEMKQPGQYRNMVVIYTHQGRTLQESVDHVAMRVRSEIAEFQRLANRVEAAASKEMRGFIAGLRNWMRGYQDWVDFDTQRYANEHIDDDADDSRISV